jgi:hypothetical protein
VWHRNQHKALTVSGATVALAGPLKNCQGTVDVIGTIATNGAGGPISYQWTENSTALKATTVTGASGADTVQVTLRWVFHGKGTQQATAELQVISPNSSVANTQFTYSCK